MALPAVAGTKIRGGRYFLNLHIPASIQAAFGGKDRLTASLKTSDPVVAKKGVILAQAKLIEAEEAAAGRKLLAEADLITKRKAAEARAMLEQIMLTLPADQKALVEEVGTVDRLRQQYDRATIARAFLVAGGAYTEPSPDVEDGDISTTRQASADMAKALQDGIAGAMTGELDFKGIVDSLRRSLAQNLSGVLTGKLLGRFGGDRSRSDRGG